LNGGTASGASHGRMRLLVRLARQVRAHWPFVAAIVVLDLLAMPVALLMPVPLKIAVDSVIGAGPLPAWVVSSWGGARWSTPEAVLALAVGMVLAVALVGQGQRFATWWLQAWTGERIVLGFRAELFRQVQRLSLAYHDARGTADSIYRIQYDAPAIQWIAVYGIAPFVTSILTLLGMIAVMWAIDASLAAIALVVVPILFFMTHRFARRLLQDWHQVKEYESSAASVVQEVLGALRVVKAFGQERREEERFVERAGREVRANVRVVRAQGIFYAGIGLVLAAGSAAALFVGVRHVQSGILTVGDLTLVIAYLAQLYHPLETLSTKVTELQKSFASAERAFALLDHAVDVADRPEAKPLERARGEIEFRNVSFGYDGKPPVIEAVSLHVDAGTRIGIVGKTGAGKTTLVNLVVRFYDPSEGAIFLDGIDLRDLRLADLRRQYAIVLQEPVLFSATIAENIGYGRADASEDEIVAAAKAANAHDFIMQLPDGYATHVGERGMMLSGGERQRVSLARAFLKDAPVLILDEPTSAVDTRTEEAIVDALQRLMRGRTTLIIAHRLSTLRHCDRVYAVEGGRLVPYAGAVSLPMLASDTPPVGAVSA
jgi:ATP-binding cassette subfamily B protein